MFFKTKKDTEIDLSDIPFATKEPEVDLSDIPVATAEPEIDLSDIPAATKEPEVDLSDIPMAASQEPDLEAQMKKQKEDKARLEQEQIAQAQAAQAKAADPANWSADQTKKHFKENPPRNIEEAVKAKATVAIKTLQENKMVSDIKNLVDQSLVKPAKTAYGGTLKAAGKTAGTLDFYADKIADKLGIPQTRDSIFEELKKNWEFYGDKLLSEGLSDGVAKKIYQGLGEAGWEVPKLMSMGVVAKGATLPIAGAVEGFEEGGAKGAAAGAAGGALMHGTIKGLQTLPGVLKYPAAFGVGAATTPGDIKEKVAGGAVFTGLSAGKSPSMEEFKETQKKYSPLSKQQEVPQAKDYQILKDSLEQANAKRISEGKEISETEKFAQEYVVNNLEEAKQKYIERAIKDYGAPNIITSDVGKYAIPGMKAENSSDYHEAGSALKNVVEQQFLNNEATKDLPIGFTAGGTGAGKTHTLKTIGKGVPLDKQYALIYDTNLSDFDSAKRKIDAALATGRKVEIIGIYRDPLVAFKEGVIPRVKTQDRLITVGGHSETHMGYQDVLSKIRTAYPEGKVSIRIYSNTGQKNMIEEVPLDQMPKIGYTKGDFESRLYKLAEEAYGKGQLTESQFSAAVKDFRPAADIRSAGTAGSASNEEPTPGGLGNVGREEVRERSGLAPTEEIFSTLGHKPQAIRDLSPAESEKSVSTFSKEYGKYLKREGVTTETKETEENFIIDKVAKQKKEFVPVVKRVVSKIKEFKTRMSEFWSDTEERVQQMVEKKGAKVSDSSDPYLQSTLYSGRMASKIKEGYDKAEAIFSDIKRLSDEIKINTPSIRKSVDDFLIFRHAPERNAALGEGAAGVTTKEAEAGLASIEKLPHADRIKAIAEKVSELNSQTLEILKNSGVITEELHTTLKQKYKNHVPLNRIFEETEDIGPVLSGKGLDVKSTGIKRAVGSKREVSDILSNVVTNYEQAVMRSEKNIVDQATLAFARQNKDILGDTFEIISPKAIGKTFDGQILRERTTDPSILQMFEKGKPIWIKVNDKQLAIALRGVGREKLATPFQVVGAFTRFYAGLATRFNPDFAFPNKIRDLQETMTFMASQKDIGFKGAGKMLMKDPVSIKSILDYIRGIDNEGSRLYKEMQEKGGTTGGFGLSTKTQVDLNLKRLEKLANSRTYRIADNLVKYIDNWNTIFEDSTRLSVYRQALEQGLSKDRAAFLAKEASINFNRMGRGGPILNAFYMFSNASIRGSVKMVKSLKNPKVLGAVVMTMSAAVAATNQWNDKVDPEWRDKVSKWDRLNGLPIVIPTMDGGVKYITIPVSWGLKPIKVMADYGYDALSGQKIDTKAMINDAAGAMFDAYNPLGGTDIASAYTPTIMDTPSEIFRNRSWTGGKIRPDWDRNAPRDILYFDSLGKTTMGRKMISISEFLKDKANIAISPADMKYACDAYFGGTGRVVRKTYNTISGLISHKPVSASEYPLISRFYREKTAEEVGLNARGESEEIGKLLQDQSVRRFRLKQQALTLYDTLSNMSPDKANEQVKLLKQEDPILYEKVKDVADEKRLGLTYQDKMIKQLGVENGERAKYIFKKIMALPEDRQQDYYTSLRTKKLITSDVNRQLKWLLEHQ